MNSNIKGCYDARLDEDLCQSLCQIVMCNVTVAVVVEISLFSAATAVYFVMQIICFGEKVYQG